MRPARCWSGTAGRSRSSSGTRWWGCSVCRRPTRTTRLRACRAALEIQERIAELNIDFETRFGSGIAVRIGVNTGEVVAGDAARREMFASGDAVVLGDCDQRGRQTRAGGRPGRDPGRRGDLPPGAGRGRGRARRARRGEGEVGAAHLLPAARRRRAGPTRARRRRCACRAVRASWGSSRRELERAVAGGCRLVTVVGRAGCRKVAARSGAPRGSGGPGAGGAGGLPLLRGGDHVLAAHTGGAGAGGDRGRGVAPGGAGTARCVCRGRRRTGPAVAAQMAQLLGLVEGGTTWEELAWAVRRFLAAAAVEKPLVVVFDDIHWAEPSLLDLIAGLPVALADAPVLIVCLARDELLERVPDWPVTIAVAAIGRGRRRRAAREPGRPGGGAATAGAHGSGEPAVRRGARGDARRRGRPSRGRERVRAAGRARPDRAPADAERAPLGPARPARQRAA